MSVNFAKNQDDITNAWRKVVDEKDKPNWALYSYEGNTNAIKLMSTGSTGLASLVQELNCSLIQYAFCRVIEVESNVNKLVLINWQGDSAPLSRKGLCASHVGDVANYFKGATQTITIRNDDEATVDYLMAQIIKSRPNRIDSCMTKQAATQLEQTLTSNNSLDQVTSRQVELGPNDGAQIAKDRKTFWQLQEEEEKLRLSEEKKRAAEKQAQFERERTLREQSEAKKLAETVKERDRFIEATRNAERRESASSMSSNHSSFASFNTNNRTNDNNDYDERVGRRSELIRLERNQETQSLISKGQIKNRRALFERASQEKSSTQPTVSNSSTLSRRASGAMIKKRLDAFQSMDQGQSITKPVENIVDRTNNLRINDEPKPKSNVIVTSAIESVKLTNNDPHQDQPKVPITSPSKPVEIQEQQQQEQKLNTSPVKEPTNGITNQHAVVANGTSKPRVVKEEEVQEEVAVINKDDDDETASDYQRELEQTKKSESCLLQKKENGNSNAIQNANSNGNGFGRQHDPSRSPSPKPNNDAKQLNGSGDFSENNNHITVTKSPDELQAFKKIAEAMMINEEESEKAKPKAVAIYDYQAADKTEISFDPNDLIGFIEKVDVGWWHGVVLSGKHAGQRGLFPHNHVLEF